MRFGFQQHLKEHLKDKTWVYFNSGWVFGLEMLVGGHGEMGTCVQETSTLASCVTSPKPAVLVMLWPDKSVKPQDQRGHPDWEKRWGLWQQKAPDKAQTPQNKNPAHKHCFI